MQSWPTKDPDEVLDYQFDWTDRLVTGETISTSVFSKASDDTITLGSTSVSGAVTTVWISAGTIGELCEVTNRVTTSAGRTYDETARLRIRSK